jgi:predicted CopG family antitoxin
MRQLKIRISDEEWEMLVSIMDFEDRSASESIRDFVHRRYREIEREPKDDPGSIAEALTTLATRVKSLRHTPKTRQR